MILILLVAFPWILWSSQCLGDGWTTAACLRFHHRSMSMHSFYCSPSYFICLLILSAPWQDGVVELSVAQQKTRLGDTLGQRQWSRLLPKAFLVYLFHLFLKTWWLHSPIGHPRGLWLLLLEKLKPKASLLQFTSYIPPVGRENSFFHLSVQWPLGYLKPLIMFPR